MQNPKQTSQPSSSWARMTAMVGLVICCLAGIGYTFYQQDWRYTVPTPQPKGYPAVPTRLAIAPGNKGKLRLYHFYNPDCPCSRFAQPEVERLEVKFAGQVEVIYVREEEAPQPASSRTPTKKGPIKKNQILDQDGQFARSMGVYCTPVAVLAGADGQVLYTGNYNRARACSDAATAYVARACQAALAGKPVPAQPSAPYGCALPALATAE